jgi:1-acyl-sn-glycerol-3-phosphate acyltransferase
MPSFPGGNYYIEPTTLEHVVDTFVADPDQLPPASFAERCRRVRPLLTQAVAVDGSANIPTQGPLVVIKSHPMHYDGLLLDAVFDAHPNLRMLAKPSSLMNQLPADNTLLMRKVGPHGNYDDIQKLQTHLGSGGSLLATPWGCLNHQARERVSSARAAQNVVRFASFAAATVLPVCIDVEYGNSQLMPAHRAIVTYGEPIIPLVNGELDEAAITAAVINMYEHYTS